MTLEERTVAKPLSPAALAELRGMIHGEVIAPGDAGYDTARQPWNLHARQAPAVIVAAADVDDVVAAVRFAGPHNLPVAMMRTGHGAVVPCDGGLLLLTERLQGVEVDPIASVARFSAGALWQDVMTKTLEHGLIPLVGSTPFVGAVGYSLGGGTGWLARKYGLATDSVRAFDIVTADGQLRHATAEIEPDLFWAARGGGGNFGVVTSIECQIYPVTDVYGGNLYYPIEAASDVLAAYAQWVKTLPEAFTTGFLMMRFPSLPIVPEPLRDKSFAIVRGCYIGQAADGEALLRPMREVSPVAIDMFGPMQTRDLKTISNDPEDPMPICSWSETFEDLPSAAQQTLTQMMASSPPLPFYAIELRHIGGSAAIRSPRVDSAFSLRQTEYMLFCYGLIPAPELEPAVKSYFAELAAALRPYASGALYYNFLGEMDTTPERARATHSREHLRRLGAIKAAYDPKNMFRFNPNIAPSEATPAR